MRAILHKIQSQMDRDLYPGASLAFFHNGKWQSYYLGTQDGQQKTVSGLVYDLASVSKVVGVATVLIQLISQGKVELDQSLKYYYPDVRDETLTIRQLLTHTSGIDPFIPNRDKLDAAGLKKAIDTISVTTDKAFRYTDVNFILLGFLLESIFEESLEVIFREQVFEPWQMRQTQFGPVSGAVPTIAGALTGQVHDPKARVLGRHCGSAGLFSTLDDLQLFCQAYLQTDFGLNLEANYGSLEKPRSLGWNLDGDWLDHTGYTGPFLMLNRPAQQAVIFLTNRTFAYDDRQLWITKRRELRDVIKDEMEKLMFKEH
ncbi:serine hydrolase domain-containing protein [Streptococcus merionis]|uniref:serine hydrolase domain-containing protein n=1 Tax=Streptococcus merionis TaxID=400065 RepID=UPI0035186B68